MMFSVCHPELCITLSTAGGSVIWDPKCGLSLILIHLDPTSLICTAKGGRGLVPTNI